MSLSACVAACFRVVREKKKRVRDVSGVYASPSPGTDILDNAAHKGARLNYGYIIKVWLRSRGWKPLHA